MIRENFTLRYSSLFSFTPKKSYANHEFNIPNQNELDRAYSLMQILKNDQEVIVGEKKENFNFIEYTARYIKKRLNEKEFAAKFSFFGDDAILVPIPKSTLMKGDTLWVPKRIALELEKQGLGKYIDLLERIYSVNRSSTSQPSDRPLPEEHYKSTRIKDTFIEVGKNTTFVLVDDVITRGSTLLGCANRILDVWSNVEIYGFAIFRTISNYTDFKYFLDPKTGKIKYRTETKDTIRDDLEILRF